MAAAAVPLPEGHRVGLRRVGLEHLSQLGQDLVGGAGDPLGLHRVEGLQRPVVGELALQGLVVLRWPGRWWRRAQGGDVQLVLPEQLRQHRKAVAVAAGHGLVGGVQPGLGLGDQVTPAQLGVGTHAVAEHHLDVVGGQVGRGTPAGEHVPIVLEREAVGAGPEPRIGATGRGAGRRSATACQSQHHQCQYHAQRAHSPQIRSAYPGGGEEANGP